MTKEVCIPAYFVSACSSLHAVASVSPSLLASCRLLHPQPLIARTQTNHNIDQVLVLHVAVQGTPLHAVQCDDEDEAKSVMQHPGNNPSGFSTWECKSAITVRVMQGHVPP